MSLTALDAHAINEYSTAAGPADYALVFDGRILGIVEAEKYEVGSGGILP